MAEWWSIEVLHGEVSAFRWQEQHDSALIEAALTNGVRDGAWHADRWGVVFEVLFGTEEQWEAFRSLPVVRAALDAVPDPVNGLLIYRGRGGAAGAREPRRPKPAPSSGAVSLPGPSDEAYLDPAADSAPTAADARPVTAAALQRPPGTRRPGLAGMMLADTVPVLRPPVCGTEELAATGRSVTGRECLKRSQAPEPPIWRQVPVSRHIVRAGPERPFCFADVCQYSPPDNTCSHGSGPPYPMYRITCPSRAPGRGPFPCHHWQTSGGVPDNRPLSRPWPGPTAG